MTDRLANPSSQPYELFMFARKHGLPLEQARMIIDEHGCDRAGADAAATACLKHGSPRALEGGRAMPSVSDCRCG
jgi:hypothetical protein